MAIPWKKVGLGLVVAVAALLALAITATVGWRALLFGPRSRPLTARSFESTPERLERGRYLAESVFGCVGCHSERDWKAPGATVAAGRLGAGHVWSDEAMPWLTSPNLTPDPETGIGRWSDDTVARAVREGIGHDGRALFPLMPYQAYRRMPDEDLASIVVYLRQLPPVRNPLPPTALPFPLGVLVRAVPEPLAAPVPAPDLSTPVKRGEYLVRTIDCAGCHTPRRHGDRVPGMDLAGGNVFETPVGVLTATNLTPDATGIPFYDEELFVEAMRTGKVKARALSPVMPWAFFGKMNDEDLKAIYAYLKTLPAVKHRVSATEPATKCPRCGLDHGWGDQNGI